nr:enhanced serine sensitivity protein SseB C-terminal domain-containing protein [Feifania hominis]
MVQQIAAMGESHGRALEDLFVENLKTARLLCPIELANGRRGTDGVMQWDERASIQLAGLQNAEGDVYLPAFTDWESLSARGEKMGRRALILGFDDLRYLCGRNGCEGVVLNPYGDSLSLRRSLMEELAQRELLYRAPDARAAKLMEQMRALFESAALTKRAYLLLVRRPDGADDYLIVLERPSSPSAIGALLRTVRPHLNGRRVRLAALESDFGWRITRGIEPVYRRD